MHTLPSTTQPMSHASRITFDQLVNPVLGEFQKIDHRINKELSSQVPLIKQVAEFTTTSGGKRLRPLLTLLAAYGCGYSHGSDTHEQAPITMAIVVEFLHTASLLHDDVVDDSSLRRGQPSANQQWGNATSVLVGDFIYARAFQLLVELKQLPLQSIVADAIQTITEGEVFQLMNKHQADLSEADYFKIIQGKTAAMFSAAAECGAVIAGAPETHRQALKTYAIHLGCAFQIIDDLLDYTGNTPELGKNIGDDLAEGKTTLPLIYGLQSENTELQHLIRQAIQSGGTEQLGSLLTALDQAGIFIATHQRAEQEAQLAIQALSILPESDYKQALLNLVQFSIQRSQ